MSSSGLHALAVRNNANSKMLRRKIRLTFNNAQSLEARTVQVSTTELTLMSPYRLRKGFLCKVEFDMLLNGKLQKITAVSETQESVCAGMEGFRIDMKFINLNEQSRQHLQDLMNYGK